VLRPDPALIADGRIHPARIEEIVQKVTKEIGQTIYEEGEKALFEVGIHTMSPELIRTLGRLHYRTSYGQNVLAHSKEVAEIAGMIAAEVGGNVEIAKRAAVINAIGSHHGDVEPETVEAVIVQTADAVSASRPGARKETLDSYLKRLENLEGIAEEFEGVDKAYAIQAGRELRILVNNEKVSDEAAKDLAKGIAKRIEGELKYPGRIKVTIIRELRVVEYAR
jgi:ribonuclease Y